MHTNSLRERTIPIALCCLLSLSCRPTDTEDGASFGEDDYLNAARVFAEAISARDYDGAWRLASEHLRSETDRASFEESCETFFERLAKPTGVRGVSINAVGDELSMELEDLGSTVPAEAAIAWCVASLQADMDIKLGVILVPESGTLAIGDFWLFDD